MTWRIDASGRRCGELAAGRSRGWLRAGAAGVALGLAGCAGYEPLALPAHHNLASGLSQLDLVLPPAASGEAPASLDPGRALSPDQVGLLAMVNDPDLAAARGKIAVADADRLAARLLPNPSLGFGYAALVSGPATADAITASLSQDIQSIVTYRPRVAAAEARYGQVGADALWQAWQVAQKAKLLAIGLNEDEREIRLRAREDALLSHELEEVQRATAAGNLDLTAEAPLMAAAASAQRDLAAARLQELKDWQDLDALLGLEPGVRFAIAAPAPVTLPADIAALADAVASRRPDLVALRLGYDASEADVRAAILGQFPAFSFGIAGGSDTSEVVSVGPQVTFDLPIFNHNQARIASAQATRLQLHAEYQARLDEAEGMARSFLARARIAASGLERARRDAATASRLLDEAQHAYGQGNLDQRALADYQTTALDRELDTLAYERSLQENSLALAVELGVGFPRTILAPPHQETRS